METMRRMARAATMIVALSFSGAAVAQTGSVHLHAKFELTFDCERPFFVRSHPIHADFTAILNANKTASADLAITGMFSTSNVHFDARLGGGSQPAPGGSSQLRVVSSNRLRAVWDLPNNQLILDMTAAKASCSTALSIRLKPGKQEYTMFDGSTFYYCSGQRLIGSTCQVQ